MFFCYFSHKTEIKNIFPELFYTQIFYKLPIYFLAVSFQTPNNYEDVHF